MQSIKEITETIKQHIDSKFEIIKAREKFMLTRTNGIYVFNKLEESEDSIYLKNSGTIVLIIKKRK